MLWPLEGNLELHHIYDGVSLIWDLCLIRDIQQMDFVEQVYCTLFRMCMAILYWGADD